MCADAIKLFSRGGDRLNGMCISIVMRTLKEHTGMRIAIPVTAQSSSYCYCVGCAIQGAAQTVHELTASGMATNWYSTSIMFYNDNRANTSKADTQGNGIVDRDCIFPFRYNGVAYDRCTMVDQNVPWCATAVDGEGNYVGEWGVCSSFVNNAPSNYGEIEISFAARQLALRIVTPNVTPTISGELNVTWPSSARQGSCFRGHRRVEGVCSGL